MIFLQLFLIITAIAFVGRIIKAFLFKVKFEGFLEFIDSLGIAFYGTLGAVMYQGLKI